jgi:ribosomal protein L37AE/L43A
MPTNTTTTLRYPDLDVPNITLPKEKEIKFQLEPFGILRTGGEFLPILCIEGIYDKLLISYYMNLLSAYSVRDLNDDLNRLPADTFTSSAPNIRRVVATLAEERLPDAWIYLCSAYKHKGGEDLIYMSLNEHVVVSTMELFIRDSNNPTWQNIRVRYHRNLYGLIHNRPKVSLSMQGFIRRFFNREATDEELKDIYELFIVPDLERNNLDLDSLEFHYIQGDEPNAADVITKAYTNVDRRCDTWGDYYPSPLGSCMRHTEWYADYDVNNYFYIGTTDQCDYSHPVAAYATKDIGFAWLTDSNGFTVARTLVNLTASDENYAGLPTAVRVYACCLSSDPDETTRKEHWDELADHLMIKLKAHLGHPVSVDEDRGLLDCTVKPQSVEEDLWVAPYIDGDHKSVDLDTFRVVSCAYEATYGRTIKCDSHNPPVTEETLGIQCRQCGQLLSHGERLGRVAEGVWMCPTCAAERHEAKA